MSVDVIMRTKDRPLLLARAIRSVASQTRDDWRLIIVNDGGRRDAVDDLVAKIGSEEAGRVRVRGAGEEGEHDRGYEFSHGCLPKGDVPPSGAPRLRGRPR